MSYIIQLVSRTRQMRADYGLTNRQKPALSILCTDNRLHDALTSAASDIEALSLSSGVSVISQKDASLVGCSAAIIDASTSVYLQLKGILDPVKELQKLGKKLADVEKTITQVENKINFGSYQEKTPKHIKDEDSKKLKEKRQEAEHIKECMQSMEELQQA